MQQKYKIDLEAAKKVAAAAQLEADRNGWNIVIAIVDDGVTLFATPERSKCQHKQSLTRNPQRL